MAGLETDGVNKNDNSNYVNILRQTQAVIESPENHSHEKHGCDAQLEAEQFDIADKIA